MFLQILPPLMRGVDAPIAMRLEVADLQLPASLVEIDNVTVTVENAVRNALIVPADLVSQPMPAPDPPDCGDLYPPVRGVIEPSTNPSWHISLGADADDPRFDPDPIHGDHREGTLHHRSHVAPSLGGRGNQLPRTRRRGSRSAGRRAVEFGTHCRGNCTPTWLFGDGRIHSSPYSVEWAPTQ